MLPTTGLAYLNNNPDFQWHTAINPINKTRGAVLRANHQVMFSGAAGKGYGLELRQLPRRAGQ